ncbi:FxsA Protein affecting phage T7 exclusion by the F plasmid [Rhabdaerophilaceae bacterium]
MNVPLAGSGAWFIRRPGFWFLLWLGLEFVLISLLANRFGLGLTLLALVLKSGAGLLSLGILMSRALSRLPAGGLSPQRIIQMGFGVLAGVLLAMPGLVLTILALLLLAPSIRALIASRFMKTAAPEDDGIVTLQPDEWRDITPATPEIASDPRQRP